MNQRVNIQYSIEMGDLDYELERLLIRSRDCMQDTNSTLENLVKEIIFMEPFWNKKKKLLAK